MPKVAVVVPCYNEAERLPVNAFEDFIGNHDYHFLFVNDGSTDDTAELLAKLADTQSQFSALELEHNVGKAEAVRAGILHILTSDSSYDLVGFIDADLATPLEELVPFVQLLEKSPDYRLVMGSRWKRLGSRIRRSTLRHYLGRIFATVVSITFDLNVYDTQCGAKMMRCQDLKPIFSEPFISPWFFDIEILCRFRQRFPDEPVDDWAAETPLTTWHEVGGSRVKLFDFLLAPLALWKIRRHYR